MVQECPSAMVRDCSAGTGWRGAATSTGRGRRTVTASRHCTCILSHHCKCDDVRNNCEMTHFFFSLIREPLQEQKLMPLVFYFDTHIITQVTLNVRHTFFDKVRLQINKLYQQINTSFEHLPRCPPSEAHLVCSAECRWSPCWSCSTTWWSSSGGPPAGRRRWSHQRS